jgi:succinoglycan biosynthesis transport protein ExoP
MTTHTAEDPLGAGAPGAQAGGSDDARRLLGALMRFLGRRWWILLLAMATLGFGIHTYAESLPRTYACTPAVIELVQAPPASARSLEAYEVSVSNTAWYVVPTQVAVLSTGQVLDPVIEQLGLRARPDYAGLSARIDAKAKDYTTLISLSVKGPDPEMNARIANAVADEYRLLRQAERDKFLDRMAEDAVAQVKSRQADLVAADLRIQTWRTEHKITDPKGVEETTRNRIANLFALLKTAEAERDRAVEAEAQIRAAEKDGRDLADVTAIREDEDVRAVVDEMEGLTEEVESLRLRLPEGSTDPALVLARQRVEAQRQKLRRLVTARAEDLKIAARKGTDRATGLGEELTREQNGLERIVSLGVELTGLFDVRERAAARLAEAQEDSRSFNDVKARQTDAVQIRSRAQPSSAVVAPKLSVIYLGGGLLAFLVALALALLVDLSSGRLREPADIARVAGAPFLGVVPILPPGRTGLSPSRWVLEEADGEASEAYRLVAATCLLHGSDGDPPKVIAVTSPQEGDGKTTTAIGLAVSLARRGNRVLLVDADLRRPSIHGILGVGSAPGLTQLFGDGDVWGAVRVVEIGENLGDVVRFDLLTAGIIPPNPADILPGTRMQRFLLEARERYDAVVVDTPPVTVVSDASLLAPYTDGVILVMRDRRTHRGPLHRASARLKGVRAQIRGVILNAARRHRATKYGYGYGYGYKSKAAGEYGYGQSSGSRAAAPPGTVMAPGTQRNGAGGGNAPKHVEVRVQPSRSEAGAPT